MKRGLCILMSLVLALAVFAGAYAETKDWVTPVQNIEKWDREVDYLVVGFGLDYEDYYRNLPYVGVLKPAVYLEK